MDSLYNIIDWMHTNFIIYYEKIIILREEDEGKKK